MLDFQPITLEAIASFAPYLRGHNGRLCDFTPVNLYIWRGYFYCAYAIDKNMLFLRLCTDDGKTAYAVPMGGGDLQEALCTLQTHAAAEHEPLRLSLITEEELPLIRQLFGRSLVSENDRDWEDYLYEAAPMAAYAGRDYAKQRNHVKKFEKQYPDWRVEPIAQQHLPALRTFLNHFLEQRHKQEAFAAEEIDRAHEALQNRAALGLFGVVLYVGDTLVGFSAGSIIGDTLFVHFEKAITTYEGVYQKLVHEFARRFVTPDVRYINREEDCGDEGLRKSKQSYHPTAMLPKYNVIIE